MTSLDNFLEKLRHQQTSQLESKWARLSKSKLHIALSWLKFILNTKIFKLILCDDTGLQGTVWTTFQHSHSHFKVYVDKNDTLTLPSPLFSLIKYNILYDKEKIQFWTNVIQVLCSIITHSRERFLFQRISSINSIYRIWKVLTQVFSLEALVKCNHF